MRFNLFGKKKEGVHRVTDLIFISAQAKQNAVITFAKAHADFIFIVWFQNTFLHYRQLFTQQSIDENCDEEAKYYSAGKYLGRQVIFLEHYLLRNKKIDLVHHCIQQSFTVYNALTEPLFTYFGGEKIITLMQKMGVAESEFMEHKMISRSLQRAQEKITGKVSRDQPAASQEDWMRKNFKTA